ncbi:MAG TPA: tetratricopeptide repeat protein [Oscillatoriales cyanobacterium M59_W2019_021]|nr:MAG: tetratricopeptide repeat protein [Cyanobacteria bacterium J055]HIK33904.1 tetratricopeptide repeat protein [Oscillatoriales cyanobacterium M4454_W2019_049]HIK49934.1 tetratricopeptide repeat protein [Oscillatoriales cyanobacterium M59_W2019_021]
MKHSFQTRAVAWVLFGLLHSSTLSGIVYPWRVLAQSIPDEVGRGYNLLELGWVDDAIAAFEDALALYPDSVPANLGLAIAYRRAGRDNDAWEAYDRVLELDPTNALALKTVGLLGTYRPEWQSRGIDALTVFLNSTPEDTEARALRALLYGYQSRISEALADYQILLQSPNPTPDVLLGAAQIYVYSGNSPQGLELFDRYRRTGGAITGYAAIAYARALRETGNPAAGITVLEAQLAALPGNNPTATEARAELARSYLATNQPEQALAALQPLRGRSEAALTLARGLSEIGRRTDRLALLQESAVLYREVLSQTPNPPVPLLQEAADVLASIPGEEELALQLYRQLAAQQPDNRVLAVQQLAFESQLGQIAQPDLRSRLATLLEPLPDNPRDLDRIAGALIRIDPPDSQLLPVYQNLIAAGVDRPFLNFRIAQMFLQLNDPAAARQALEAYIAGIDGRPDPASDIILADIERREGNLEASEQRYQVLLSEYADDDNLVEASLQGLIGVRIAQNRLPEAIALYDQLIARRPEDFTLQLGRTSLAYQEDLIERSEAETVLQNWLTTQPATATPPELFSLVGALPADPSREALYDRLIQVDPYYMPIQFRSIQVLALRDPEAAQAKVARMIAQDPTNLGAYFVQGEIAQNQGDLELAGNAYQAILGWEPENADALAALGGVRFQQRDLDAAQQLYERALALDPDDPNLRRSMAGLTAARDYPLSALEQLEELQLEQMAKGAIPDPEISNQIQQLHEDFLRRRGFQPPWERY